MGHVGVCGAKWLEGESMGLPDGLKVAMLLMSKAYSSSL